MDCWESGRKGENELEKRQLVPVSLPFARAAHVLVLGAQTVLSVIPDAEQAAPGIIQVCHT